MFKDMTMYDKIICPKFIFSYLEAGIEEGLYQPIKKLQGGKGHCTKLFWCTKLTKKLWLLFIFMVSMAIYISVMSFQRIIQVRKG